MLLSKLQSGSYIKFVIHESKNDNLDENDFSKQQTNLNSNLVGIFLNVSLMISVNKVFQRNI